MRSAVGIVEDLHDIFAVFRIVDRLVDEIHRPSNLILGESRYGGEDAADAIAVRGSSRSDVHERQDAEGRTQNIQAVFRPSAF